MISVFHLARGHAELRVSDLPHTSPNSPTVVGVVDLRPGPIDTTPGPEGPPLHMGASALPDAELDLVTRAAGLSLQDRARSSGDREIRVFIHGGDGTPDRAAILRRSRGLVSGEVWFWWMLGPFGLSIAQDARDLAAALGCGDAPWRWGTVLEDSSPAWRAVLACRATLPVTPDWPGMWRRLDSLGVWRLPDQTARLHNHHPFVRQGAAFITLDLFDGRTHRRIRQGDPDSSAAPGVTRAAAIARAVDEGFRGHRYELSRVPPRPPVGLLIAGTVRDTVGRPVARALVSVPALPASVRTGADGGFELPFLVSNTALVSVESDGYLPAWYHVWELPRSSYGPGSRVRTEIVLHSAPVVPDSMAVYDTTAHDLDTLRGHRIRIRGHNDGPLPSIRCTSGPTSDDRPFDVRQVRDLAGDYDMILVDTTSRSSGATEHRGRLFLWVQDSVRSHRAFNGKQVLGRGFERPLAGSFVAAPPDTDAYWRRMASTNLNHPGGVWMWNHLRLGDYDGLDGSGEDLRVTHTGPSGFRGQWHSDLGIAVVIDTVTHELVPNPGGYFCAYR